MKRWLGRRLALTAGIGLVGTAGPLWAQSWNLYSGYTDTATLTFAAPVQNPVEQGQFPELHLSLSGRDAGLFTMDTGSMGIVVSSNLFTPGPNDVSRGPGKVIYTSSNQTLTGTYWDTQVKVTGANGSTITSSVRILVVPREQTHNEVRMMGVGFDRGGNPDSSISQPTNAMNPFLNIVEIDGRAVTNMRNGYVVGPDGVTLGLTAAQASGFAMVKLTPNTIIPENVWNRAQMSLAVDGRAIGTGSFLPDSGIAYMIMTPRSSVPAADRVSCRSISSTAECAPNGTHIAISLTPGLPADVATQYSFTVRTDREGHPLNPAEVNVRASDTSNRLATEVSVNSGEAIFLGFDYLFDFDGGYVGYRWRDAAGAVGGVTPLLSLQGSLSLPSGFAASLPVYLADATTLRPAGQATLAAPVFGLGRGLTVDGSGAIAFNAPVDMAGGNFTVTRGLAAINSTLSAPTVSVGAEGWLGGSGTITGNVVSAGTVAPGNSIGTLSVIGSYTQTAGSTYRPEVNAAGESDRLAVGGTATIQPGSTVTVVPAAGLYGLRTSYTILSATGGIAGTYSSAISTAPFLRPSLSYDANTVLLTLQIGGFAAAAQDANQGAVGAMLDAAAPGATGDLAAVLANLSTASLEQGRAFLTSISGQNYAGFSSAMVQGAQFFMSNFASQAGGGGAGESGRVALAEACDTACDSVMPARWGAWGGAIGGLGTIGSGTTTGAVTYNLGGFAAGLDRLLAPGLRAGVTLGYAAGTQWVSGFSGQGQSSTYQAGLYANYSEGRLYLDALAGYAYSDNRMTRSIAVPSLGTRLAQGQTGANQFFGQLEGGYRFDLGGAAAAFVTPFARLQAYTGTQNGFSETGAQSLNLSVAAVTTNSLRSVIGAQLGAGFDLGWRDTLALAFRLGWSHDYADTARPVTATLAGAPATPFTTFGIAPRRDSAVIGFNAATAVADATKLYLRYEGNLSGQDSTHALTAGVRLTW